MKIGCIASNKNEKALNLQKNLKEKYKEKILYIDNISDIKNFDIEVLIVLGGDGFMLRILHQILTLKNHPNVYGINCGHLGFLLNEYSSEDDLMKKINEALPIKLNPLQIKLHSKKTLHKEIFAINEISLIRQTYQSIHINVFVNDVLRLENLSGDGALIATAPGSAAYNRSAGGVILPIQSEMLSITAINGFRPKNWNSAILPDTARVRFELLNSESRPALACADFQQFYFVEKIEAYVNKEIFYTLLFDKKLHLEEKIMQEQFSL